MSPLVYVRSMKKSKKMLGFLAYETLGIIPANLVDEEELVRSVGERIGYGLTMRLCEKLWGEYLEELGSPASGAHATYCCVAFLVPCPGCEIARDQGMNCDWCCGAGRVTEKVRDAILSTDSV